MKAAIIGIGNPLMGDDGAGIIVLKLLKKIDIPDHVRIIDIGTGGISLLHILADLDIAIIVDATDFGGHPGEIRSFELEEARSIKTLSYSLHDWDLFTTIELSKKWINVLRISGYL